MSCSPTAPHNSIFIRSTDHHIFLTYIPPSTHIHYSSSGFYFSFVVFKNPLVGVPASNLLPYALLIIPRAILKTFRDSIKSKLIPVASSSTYLSSSVSLYPIYKGIPSPYRLLTFFHMPATSDYLSAF